MIELGVFLELIWRENNSTKRTVTVKSKLCNTHSLCFDFRKQTTQHNTERHLVASSAMNMIFQIDQSLTNRTMIVCTNLRHLNKSQTNRALTHRTSAKRFVTKRLSKRSLNSKQTVTISCLSHYRLFRNPFGAVFAAHKVGAGSDVRARRKNTSIVKLCQSFEQLKEKNTNNFEMQN
jgi:hypothetical protein